MWPTIEARSYPTTAVAFPVVKKMLRQLGTTYTVTVNGVSGAGSLGLNLADNDSALPANSWRITRKPGKPRSGNLACCPHVSHEHVGSTLFFRAGC